MCYKKCWISAFNKVAIGSHLLDILVLMVFSGVFLYDFTSRQFCEPVIVVDVIIDFTAILIVYSPIMISSSLRNLAV